MQASTNIGQTPERRAGPRRLLAVSAALVMALAALLLTLALSSIIGPSNAAVQGKIGSHNPEVRHSAEGVRIVVCLLPKQSPWLNAIEPKWVHGKRKVVELDGDPLDAYELAERVCRVFDCPHYEHLSITERRCALGRRASAPSPGAVPFRPPPVLHQDAPRVLQPYPAPQAGGFPVYPQPLSDLCSLLAPSAAARTMRARRASL